MIKIRLSNLSSLLSPPVKRVMPALYAFMVLGLLFWFVPPVWQLHGDSIQMVRWLKKGGMTMVTVGPTQPGWSPLDNVSRHVLNAIVVAEDAKFYDHWGIDVAAVWDSLVTDVRKGRYARGGSTITQQVVKKAFLPMEKSMLRKAREALGAVLLECFLSKDQILVWYINIIEFGDGVYGINEAAHHYFDTKAELLTIQNGANLAIVIPSPNVWSIGLRQKKLTLFGQARYFQIIQRMYVNRLITRDLYLNALATGDFGRPVLAYKSILSEQESTRMKNAAGDSD